MTPKELRLMALEDDSNVGGGRSPAGLGPNIGKGLRLKAIQEMLERAIPKSLIPEHGVATPMRGMYSRGYDIGEGEILKIPHVEYMNLSEPGISKLEQWDRNSKINTILGGIPKKQLLSDYKLAPEFNFGLRRVGDNLIPYNVEQMLDTSTAADRISSKRFDNFINKINEAGLNPEDISLRSRFGSYGPEARNFGLDKRGMPRTYDSDLFEYPEISREELQAYLEEAMPRYIKVNPEDPGDYDAYKHILDKIIKLEGLD